ncbi:transglutaminase family protein [Vallitalea okinawensis]|uniref:transglutaminase family protein n=1 Tax=Vallitalea okinawensis TaxID=2078660 RepID=UPI0013007FE5|nr:transglutaminase domain-containing protein [Vallitalea okinawensis]
MQISLITAGCLGVLIVSLYNKKYFSIAALSLFGSVLLLGSILSYKYQMNTVINSVVTFFEEVYKTFVISDYYLAEEYHIYSIIFISFLLTLAVYFLTVKYFKPKVIIIGGLTYFVCCQMIRLSYNRYGFFIFCFIAILYYLEGNVYRRISWEGIRDGKRRLSRRSLMVFSILLMSFCLLLTHKNTNALGWVNEVASDISKILGLSTGQSTGIQEDRDVSDLENKPYHNESFMMAVEADDILYLRGMVFDTFDGTTWTGGEPQIETDNYQENIEGLHLLAEGGDVNNLYELATATVTYKNIATDLLFTHLNTVELNEIEDLEGKDYTYTFQYYRLQYDDPQFVELLRKSNKESNETIYNKYITLPQDISEDIIEIAKNITEPYDADIDKVRAIEAYLSYNYTYTLEPDLSNYDHDDMVNYFLFESKEGFCIHYASAMAVMVRALGLPARYVTGYKLPYTVPVDELLEYEYIYYEDLDVKVPASEFGIQTYAVYDTDAHAWVEVYFDGFGWLAFEPTKVFYEEFHQYADDTNLLLPTLTNLSETMIGQKEVNGKNKWVLVYGLLIFLVVVICIPLLIRLQLKIRYSHSKSKDKLILQYHYHMMLLGLLYKPTEPSCTINQYMQGVADYFKDQDIDVMQGAKIFEKSMYAQDTIQINELIFIENMYSMLKNLTKQRMKRIQYMWYRYRNKIL